MAHVTLNPKQPRTPAQQTGVSLLRGVGRGAVLPPSRHGNMFQVFKFEIQGLGFKDVWRFPMIRDAMFGGDLC